MCGRFYAAPGVTEDAIQAICLEVEARANTAKGQLGEVFPEQLVTVIARDDQTGRIFSDTMHWGFTLSFYDKDKQKMITRNLINAKAETVNTLTSFAASAKARPCIVPASFYYEWYYKDAIHQDGKLQKKGKGQKMAIAEAGSNHMNLAGIWREEKQETDTGSVMLKHFTIITTVPDDSIAYIHDRMPAILTDDQARQWLQGQVDINALLTRNVIALEAAPAEPETPAAKGQEQLTMF